MWKEKDFYKALFFATMKHDGSYMRHPSQCPYASHIFGVTMNAVKYSVNCENIDWKLIIQIGLLHDTLEDTNTTYEELLTEFGKNVADGVLALSRDESLVKSEQIPNCIEKIKGQPKEVAIIKMADRLMNVRERASGWTKEKQDAYKNEAWIIHDNLKYANEYLAEALKIAIMNY